MSSHFLLSARARTLSLATVLRLTDKEAEQAFMLVRWHVMDGKPVCPHCECAIVWDCRKANGAPRWRCKACRKSFSVTSGTLFASAKMPLRNYLAGIAIFVNEVKGKSMLALSRDLGVQYKTAFVLAHNIREAMASEWRGMQAGGAGKTVETDGGYFGGYVKPANHKENRRDRRLAKNQNGKRRVVVVVRERGGRTLPAVFRTEAAATSWIASRVRKETVLMADEAPSWNDLHARYEVSRIDHGHSTAPERASTRMVRKAFSAACAGPRLATIITSPGNIWFATPRKAPGGKIIGASTTVGRFSRSPGLRWRADPRLISAATGNGRRMPFNLMHGGRRGEMISIRTTLLTIAVAAPCIAAAQQSPMQRRWPDGATPSVAPAPHPAASSRSYADGPKPRPNPCVGISPDAIVATV